MTAAVNAAPAGASAVHASSVLVVDDEPDLLTLYELTLLREGLEVETASSVAQAREMLQARVFRAVISDMRLPDGTGLDLLRWLEDSGRLEKVIVVTAYGSPENAVTALKAGAFDYLTKPVDLRQFRAVVASAMGRSRPTPAPPAGAATPADNRGDPLRRLVGTSEAMTHVRALVEKVARSMAPVLVQGESGTGKELVARAIHDGSAPRRTAFVAVNCGAIPETLLEAEFFGVRKGAFTGANADRDGFFQAANGGTLFLDEIGDLPFAMQSKLLRAIQERAVRAIGATTEQTMNVRIVSATHKDLGAEVQARPLPPGSVLSPQRDRHQGAAAARTAGRPAGDRRRAARAALAREAGVSSPPRPGDRGARAARARYAFPGNVRELENLLHRAVALSDGDAISGADLALPEALLAGAVASTRQRARATPTAARSRRWSSTILPTA